MVIGPNECGKSTLLRGLSRLLAPRSGTVILDGKAISSIPAKEVARRLGLLPQSAIAPDGMTVADLVARGRYPHQSLLRQWSTADEEAVREGAPRRASQIRCHLLVHQPRAVYLVSVRRKKTPEASPDDSPSVRSAAVA